MIPHAIISNALIRCTRSDRKAAASFDLVREDVGLWVLELNISPGATLPEQIAAIYGELQMRFTELRNLREGSLDYTLHLTFNLPRTIPIILPTDLAQLASDCGFNIEIYVNTIKEG